MLPSIDADIRRAATLPYDFATSEAWRARVRDDVLARAWHAVPADVAARTEQLVPWTLLPGCLDEPLVDVRDADGATRTLSNVCTHRAHLVALEPRDDAERLRCRYHGRCFDLHGRFTSAPGFDGRVDERDDLPRVERAAWGPLAFVSLAPDRPFDDWSAPARRWLAGLGDVTRDASRSRTYDVAAEWLLYCDNYLEGFHVPFVHPGLSRALDLECYRTELDGDGVVQWAPARDDEHALDLPPDHPLAAERVAAIYLWIFPNLMLNRYPWGLSVNVVEPRGAGRCRVRFETWVGDAARLDRGAGADLHQVELEDEAVVERVQLGARTRLGAGRGRYAPEHERGVHHFHRLLVERLARTST